MKIHANYILALEYMALGDDGKSVSNWFSLRQISISSSTVYGCYGIQFCIIS